MRRSPSRCRRKNAQPARPRHHVDSRWRPTTLVETWHATSLRRDNVASLRAPGSSAVFFSKQPNVFHHGGAPRKASEMYIEIRRVMGRSRQQSRRAMDDQKQGVVKPHVVSRLAAKFCRQPRHQPIRNVLGTAWGEDFRPHRTKQQLVFTGMALCEMQVSAVNVLQV